MLLHTHASSQDARNGSTKLPICQHGKAPSPSLAKSQKLALSGDQSTGQEFQERTWKIAPFAIDDLESPSLSPSGKFLDFDVKDLSLLESGILPDFLFVEPQSERVR
jgi:hypothetical protein